MPNRNRHFSNSILRYASFNQSLANFIIIKKTFRQLEIRDYITACSGLGTEMPRFFELAKREVTLRMNSKSKSEHGCGCHSHFDNSVAFKEDEEFFLIRCSAISLPSNSKHHLTWEKGKNVLGLARSLLANCIGERATRSKTQNISEGIREA